jgi:hypothetical protein
MPGPCIAGQLTFWDGGNNVSTGFWVDQNWTFVTSTMGLSNPGTTRQVRFEFYLFTVETDLLIDSANVF